MDPMGSRAYLCLPTDSTESPRQKGQERDQPMPHRITIEGSAQAFSSEVGQSALDAMVGQPSALDVGCRSGGCGVCRVEVLHGDYHCGDMSAEQVSPECRAARIALACRLYPGSDLHLRPLGRRPRGGDTPSSDIADLLSSLTRLARCTGRPAAPGA